MSRNRILPSKARVTTLGVGLIAAATLGLATPAGSFAAPDAGTQAMNAQPPPWCPPAAPTMTGTSGDDVLFGTPGDDVIDGLSGNDRIDGRGGNDIIRGGDGDDEMKGGSGPDCIDGGNGDDVLSGGPGTDRLDGGDGFDRTVRRQNRDTHMRLEH